MIEIVEFDLATFNRDAQLVEYLNSPQHKKEKKKIANKKYKNYYFKKSHRKLLARLMVSAAYREDEASINACINYLYKRLFGDSWYEDEVWMDQPINWLNIDLIRRANGFDCCDNEPWTYDELFSQTYHLINELCKDRSQIRKDSKL